MLNPIRSKEDCKKSSLILQRSFKEDPLHQWIFNRDASLIKKYSHDYWLLFMKWSLLHKNAYMNDDSTATLLATPPNHSDPNPDLALELSFFLYQSIGERLTVVSEEFKKLKSFKPKHPHWYISAIGVAPESQNLGLGKMILEDFLEKVQPSKTPVLLDATSLKNSRFYEKFGFEVIRETSFKEGPRVFSMLRSPIFP